MKRTDFQFYREICQDQPWLSKKTDVLEYLLQEECVSDDERDLIVELLKRFTYLYYQDTVSKRDSLAGKIVGDAGLEDQNTQIVAMSADSNADSGQWLLYELKPLLAELGWKRHQLVNTFGKSFKRYQSSNSHKNIVLVDEFIGSGLTVSNRVKELLKIYKDNAVEEVTIRVRVIACTEEAFERLKGEGLNIDAEILLKRGISDFNSDKDTTRKIGHIDRISQNMSAHFNGRARINLGFGDTEALYGRESGNCPNSVFPVFWWSIKADESDRPTVLIRAMADA